MSLWVPPASPARTAPRTRIAASRGLTRLWRRCAVSIVSIPLCCCQALLYTRSQRGDTALECIGRRINPAPSF
eukprot:7932599-Lingulodinium_polyedra.AAC.1